MANNDEGRFSRWRSTGLIATISWFALLITYCTFRAFGVEDPALLDAFRLLTGAYIGTLSMGLGKKPEKARGDE